MGPDCLDHAAWLNLDYGCYLREQVLLNKQSGVDKRILTVIRALSPINGLLVSALISE